MDFMESVRVLLKLCRGRPIGQRREWRTSLLADGSAGREYADAVRRGEESISPSSAGDGVRTSNDQSVFVWDPSHGKGAAW